MKSGLIQRTHSDSASSTASPPLKSWRVALGRVRNKQNVHKDQRPHSTAADDSQDSSLNLQPSHTSSSLATEANESSYRQLLSLVQKMRAAPSGPNHVDASYKELTKIKDRASALCFAITREEIKPVRHSSISFRPDPHPRRDSSMDAPGSPSQMYDQRSSFSGRSLSELITHTGTRSTGHNDAWLLAIRDWKNCLEALAEAMKTSLAETYKSYEREATPEMIDTLFSNKRFRKEAVHRMRNASVTRVLSADPQFFPRYEIRFRNYERVKEDLRETRNLLLAAECGISPDRKVVEFPIASNGDTILEFANLTSEATGDEPVLRFRVLSGKLADTSPIFARMFSGHHASLFLHDDEDISNQLPPTPSKYVCRDGFEAKLYRMPQYELNLHGSLETLLHAAHLHHDHIPVEVTFEQFVAIAECSMRYKSTSPLEPVVEHRWLPQWMHKGADDMPDGLLVISYAFGLRQLFTRMSKSAILNLVDEKDLMSKPWPARIRNKLWAVRCAKVDQVHACCTATIQEYIKPPSLEEPTDDADPMPPSEQRNNWFALYNPTQSAASLTSTPRCPKGSHWCDASNLGWMMLVLNEVDLLSHMLRPAVTSHLDDSRKASRSLARLFSALRRVPNPTAPIHRGGVCDPCPAFRSALNDIYNSVSGLTLHDVSGKSHGWALSRHKEQEPQTHMITGLRRMAAKDPNHSVATEFPETIRLKIMSKIEDLDDLHSAAMTNWAFYETYKTHELYLMRNILRNDRIRTGITRRPVVLTNINAEEKFLKQEGDQFKSHEGRLAADAMTLRSDVEDESDFDDDVSIESMSATTTSNTMWRSTSIVGGDGGCGDRSHDWPPEYPLSRRRASDVASMEGLSSPSTPRQRSPPPAGLARPSPYKPHVECTEFADEPPMTHEEAQQILWPDAAVDQTRYSGPPMLTGVEGLREKFLVGDPFFSEGLEDKSLILTGEKQPKAKNDHSESMSNGDGGTEPSRSRDHQMEGGD